VVALDYDDPEKAYRLVDELGDRIQTYKLGPVLFTRSGTEILTFLRRKGKKVFLDLKLYDTPRVVSDTIRQLGDLGAQWASVHCLGGRTMLEAAAAGCRGSQLKIIGVTLLTSQGAPDSYNWGWPQSELGMVLRLTEVALEARLGGIMCSPNELEAVRPKTVPGFVLAAPGIRLAKEEVFMEDQKRVATPRQALEWGADMIIIGRPITLAREPRAVVDRLFA
jgi:orotidine-5'-phosphate decarboxylase